MRAYLQLHHSTWRLAALFAAVLVFAAVSGVGDRPCLLTFANTILLLALLLILDRLSRASPLTARSSALASDSWSRALICPATSGLSSSISLTRDSVNCVISILCLKRCIVADQIITRQ